VSVSGVLVFTHPNFTQTLTGKLVSIFWFGVLTMIAPYQTFGENLCAFILNLSVCFIMVGGVATKVLALQVALVQITDAFGDLIDPDFADAVPWTAMALSLLTFVVSLVREVAYGNGAGGTQAGGGNAGGGAAVYPDAPPANNELARRDGARDPAEGEEADERRAGRARQQFERDIAARDRNIRVLEEKVIEYEAKFLEYEKKAADAKKTVKALRAKVAGHEKTVADMSKTVAAHEETLADQEKTAVARDRTIAEHEATIAEMAAEIEGLRRSAPVSSKPKHAGKMPNRTLEA